MNLSIDYKNLKPCLTKFDSAMTYNDAKIKTYYRKREECKLLINQFDGKLGSSAINDSEAAKWMKATINDFNSCRIINSSTIASIVYDLEDDCSKFFNYFNSLCEGAKKTDQVNESTRSNNPYSSGFTTLSKVTANSYIGINPVWNLSKNSANKTSKKTSAVKKKASKVKSIKPNKNSKKKAISKRKDNKKTAAKKTNKYTKVMGTSTKVVEYAKKFVGKPYHYGGSSLTHGTDCSGFVMRVYEKFGYHLPRTSGAQSISKYKTVSVSRLQQGDLVFYSNGSRVNHVAMYIGNGKVVHASNPASGIRISGINYRRPIKAKRIIA